MGEEDEGAEGLGSEWGLGDGGDDVEVAFVAEGLEVT